MQAFTGTPRPYAYYSVGCAASPVAAGFSLPLVTGLRCHVLSGEEDQSSLPTGSPPPLMVDGQSTKDFYVSVRALLVPGSGVDASITPVKSQAECAVVLPAATMPPPIPCLHLGLSQGWRLGWHLRTSSFPSLPTAHPTPHAFSLVPWTSLVKHKFKVKIKTVKPTLPAEQ